MSRPARLLLPLLFSAALAAPAWSATSSATIKGVDMYRSRRADLDKIVTENQELIETFLRLRSDGRRGALKSAERIQRQLQAYVAAFPGVAWTGVYYGEYFTSAGRTSYLSFEVVDAGDAKTRMPFKPMPKGERPDPGGLVAAWTEFAAIGRAMRRRGEISSERPSCPAYYCGWGAPTAELASYQQRFTKDVEEHKKALIAVLENDANSEKRAGAAFLLSYLRDGDEVVKLMVSALRDPAEDVRAAALDVLADIALYHKAVEIPVGGVVPALDYPATTDRAKVLTVLIGLAQNQRYKPDVVAKAGHLLVEHLKLKQPTLHDLAFTVLTLASSESFDRRDYKSWERWVDVTARAAAAP